MQRVHVADFVSIQVVGAEALAGFPVVERDLQLVAARSDNALTSISLARRTKVPWADADVTLGDAFARVHVNDVYSEGMVFEEVIISDCEWQPPDAAGCLTV